MKKNMSFITKIRIFLHWIRNMKGGVVETCNYCNSYSIKILKSESIENEYTSRHECLKCGATASIVELWREKGYKETL